MRLVLIAILSILISACGTIRLNYKGKVTTKKGEQAEYRLAKSYELEGPDSTFCALTAVFLGGYCWYYTVMPTTQQSLKIESDAKARLNKVYGENDYTLETKVIEVQSWSEDAEESVLKESSATVPTPRRESM